MQLLQSGEHPKKKKKIDVCEVTIREGIESMIPLTPLWLGL